MEGIQVEEGGTLHRTCLVINSISTSTSASPRSSFHPVYTLFADGHRVLDFWIERPNPGTSCNGSSLETSGFQLYPIAPKDRGRSLSPEFQVDAVETNPGLHSYMLI